jgi:hypothetical protein
LRLQSPHGTDDRAEVATLCGEDVGPRLRWLAKLKKLYVTWTERGRSYECSTSTADREEAEAFFARFMRVKDLRLPRASEDVPEMSA